MRTLERPGLFRAVPIDWSVQELPSGDPIVRVHFECREVYENEAWRDLADRRMVRGDFFVLKKGGATNEGVVSSLVKHLGWNGAFAQILDNPCPPESGIVQVEVEAREFKGKTYCQVKWINGANAKPKGAGIGHSEVRDLDKKYGGDLQKLAKKFSAQKPADDHPVDTSSIPF